MMPKRISVSNIESFRLFKHAEWMTFERLSARVKRTEPPTDKKRRGSAFHNIMESPGEHFNHRTDSYESGGFVFSRDSITDTIALLPALAGSHEVPIVGEIGGVAVSGRCDHIVGTHVDDYKTTDSIQVFPYMESYQWRLYLELFHADTFTFHVLQLGAARDEQGNVIRVDGETQLAVIGYLPIPLARYPEITRDCERLVVECRAFFEETGLIDYCSDV